LSITDLMLMVFRRLTLSDVASVHALAALKPPVAAAAVAYSHCVGPTENSFPPSTDHSPFFPFLNAGGEFYRLRFHLFCANRDTLALKPFYKRGKK